jgi:dTDP-L-rhamnose 4-epimerase
MPMMHLITGGAGFIGTRLAKALIRQGDRVRILDNLTPQVHPGLEPGSYVPPEGVEFVHGDVRDAAKVAEALRGIEVVHHLAAQTGVGQSMYQIRDYVDCNVTGTATLLEAVVSGRDRARRLVLASSRAVYGEGSYRCEEHGLVAPDERAPSRLERGEWEPVCPVCAKPVASRPTREDAALKPVSTYGLTKKIQEELSFLAGRTYGLEVAALRLFNVYGGGQSLGNPYTGILTVFYSAVRAGRAPEVYEDGRESRDFVHVDDVVRAFIAAAAMDALASDSLNIGSGTAVTIHEAARCVMTGLGLAGEPRVSGRWRAGDIRHCRADPSKAARALGFATSRSFRDGIGEFLSWADGEKPGVLEDAAREELAARGLLGGKDGR